MSKPSKLEILKGMSFGNPVAEEEQEALANYFVETNTWDEIFDGKVDVVYGPKGSGKSAIYLLIQSYSDSLFDKGILLIPAEKFVAHLLSLISSPIHPLRNASSRICGNYISSPWLAEPSKNGALPVRAQGK
jgi:hypothetical protein